jgi:hypothetical protein
VPSISSLACLRASSGDIPFLIFSAVARSRYESISAFSSSSLFFMVVTQGDRLIASETRNQLRVSTLSCRRPEE